MKDPDESVQLYITGHLIIRDGETKKEIINTRDDNQYHKHILEENEKCSKTSD